MERTLMGNAAKLIIPSLLLAMVCGLNAQDRGVDQEQSYREDCPTDPCCDECPPKDPCAKCAQLWPTCGPDWIITPNAGPCVSCGADLFVTAEYLYWATREEHLGFALLNDPTTNQATSFAEKGCVIQPDWCSSSGFKVGLGLMLDCDGWDLYANYTWLRPSTKKRTVRPTDNKVLFDLNWNQSVDGTNFDNITSISGKWELHFNVLDLELGRNFFISQCLHLRPHFGLKGTWQGQWMNVVTIGTTGSGNTLQNITAMGSFELDYWGVGIRAGLDSSWHFSPCFSLVAEVAASALWERFCSDAKSVFENQTTSLFSVPINTQDTFHTINPVLELYLGFRWENWFCCDEWHWSIELGWEQQWWANQNQFYYGITETRMGDLSFQGLTLKLRFDF